MLTRHSYITLICSGADILSSGFSSQLNKSSGCPSCSSVAYLSSGWRSWILFLQEAQAKGKHPVCCISTFTGAPPGSQWEVALPHPLWFSWCDHTLMHPALKIRIEHKQKLLQQEADQEVITQLPSVQTRHNKQILDWRLNVLLGLNSWACFQCFTKKSPQWDELLRLPRRFWHSSHVEVSGIEHPNLFKSIEKLVLAVFPALRRFKQLEWSSSTLQFENYHFYLRGSPARSRSTSPCIDQDKGRQLSFLTLVCLRKSHLQSSSSWVISNNPPLQRTYFNLWPSTFLVSRFFILETEDWAGMWTLKAVNNTHKVLHQ